MKGSREEYSCSGLSKDLLLETFGAVMRMRETETYAFLLLVVVTGKALGRCGERERRQKRGRAPQTEALSHDLSKRYTREAKGRRLRWIGLNNPSSSCSFPLASKPAESERVSV